MRKETMIILEDRGNQLTFRIREMPATRLESWIMRALLLLAGSGMDLPQGPDLAAAGRFLQKSGLKALAGIDYEKAKPLLNELLACCTRISDTGIEQICTPESVDGYIEDVQTLFKLRMEALKLNLGFFGPESESDSGSPEKMTMGRPRRTRV